VPPPDIAVLREKVRRRAFLVGQQSRLKIKIRSTLTYEGVKPPKEYGLFTRVSSLIPVHRIQLLAVRATMFHRWFGRASIDLETAALASDSPVMMVDDNDGRLKLTYREREREWTATVYNFSPKLFGMGRRFIADVKPDRDQIFKRPDSRSVRLHSVTSSGKLILIRLKEPSPAFGNISGLWLRPVLINGVERYLFYADGIIHHPGVL